MNQVLFLLIFIGCGLASTVLDIKLEQDDNLVISAIVDSNLQYFDTVVRCSEETFTVVLRQNENYDNAWSGSMLSPTSECTIIETRLTDSFGTTSAQTQHVTATSLRNKR